MSFNICHGGLGCGFPLSRTAEVIAELAPDVVGIQEKLGFGEGVDRRENRPNNGIILAEKLGWHYHDQAGRNAIISRFPIVEVTPAKHGVRLRTTEDQDFYVFNVHLAYWPYQPYQLLKIPYEDAPFLDSEQELVSSAWTARGKEVAGILEDMGNAFDSTLPVFLTGDFNEPSFLDWTERAVGAGICPKKVAYPCTKHFAGAGLIDTYRELFPDEVQNPGLTWTNTRSESDPGERHDRIDFIFKRGQGVRTLNISIIGERPERADVVVESYPSDHRALIGTFLLSSRTARF